MDTFSAKNSKFSLLAWRKKHRNQKTQRQQPNSNHVTRKNWNDANMKKSIQVKLLDFYKTKPNKPCVDMFSFLQSRLTMTQTMELARLLLLGKTSKPLLAKKFLKKTEFLNSVNMGFTENPFAELRRKII